MKNWQLKLVASAIEWWKTLWKLMELFSVTVLIGGGFALGANMMLDFLGWF